MEPINTTEAKAKLADLKKHMAEASDAMCAYAQMVGADLPDEVVPEGLALTEVTVLHNLQTATPSGTFSRLARYGKGTISLISMQFNRLVVPLVFPPEFAAAYKVFQDEVTADLAEQRRATSLSIREDIGGKEK